MSEEGHFETNNLPYGVASAPEHGLQTPQCVARFRDHVLFLAVLAGCGVLDAGLEEVFASPTLNAFAALPQPTQDRVRQTLQSLLSTASALQTLPKASVVNLKDVQMHLPIAIGDYTDFCASREHNLNAAEAILGRRVLPPAFHHFPIGYHGRASSVVVSGTPVERPVGVFVDRSGGGGGEGAVVCEATRALDYELEVGAIIGRPVGPGRRVLAAEADEHIFGLVLLNDWSARDIQGFEMNPLGPFNGKNFATTISPWVIPLSALASSKTPAPKHPNPPARHLEDPDSSNYDLELQAEILTAGTSTVTCRTNFKSMYWTFRQMLAHHVVGGCGLRTGDVIASGTVSALGELEHGCLLESTMGGKKEVLLEDGSSRTYLRDGDVVRLSGWAAGGDGGVVGLGECVGEVRAARLL